MNAFYIININIIFKLLKKLWEYENMFFISKVNRLLSHKNHDYIIEIITKSSFDSLYNLFNIELMKLKRYLKNILTKDWI